MAIETGEAGASRSPGRTLPPRIADGVELLGEFEDSGFEARRISRGAPTARSSS